MFGHLFVKFPFLSPHYAIERFIVAVGSLFLAILFVTMIICAKRGHEVEMQVTGQTQYTTEITTSLTGHTGTVDGVFSNKDSTKCFILLHWDDMSTMSRKTSDYSLFLTGSNFNLKKTMLLDNPSASLYTFGSTGYMGIFLVNANGFSNQIQKLTIRLNEQLTSNTQDISKVSDKSYAKFDMADIYFNPGGAKKTVANFLNSDSMTTDAMYYDMVMQAKEKDMRKDLNDALANLYTDLNLMTEYESRLDADEIDWHNVKSPLISDDKVTLNKKTNLYDMDTTRPVGCLNFDWQDGNIKKGYIKNLTKLSFQNYAKTLQDKEKLLEKPSYTDVTWYKKDGSVFEYDTIQLSSLSAAINTDINNCVGMWNQYYEDKQKYEDSLLDLLTLEHSLSEDWSIYEVVTSLDDKDLLAIY